MRCEHEMLFKLITVIFGEGFGNLFFSQIVDPCLEVNDCILIQTISAATETTECQRCPTIKRIFLSHEMSKLASLVNYLLYYLQQLSTFKHFFFHFSFLFRR